MIPNQWYAILPSKSVQKGVLCAVKRLNLELVLFRDEEGKLGCVVDQCPHRGAALSAGKLVGSHVRCPFHGIEFDIEGTCKVIPALGRTTKEDLFRYNVKHYAVQEEMGIIYLWYGKSEEATPSVPFFHDQLDDSFSYSEFPDLWNANYSRCIENQLDVVHVPIVHYNTIGKGNKTVVNGPKVEFDGTLLKTSANNEVDEGQKPKPPEDCTVKQIYLGFLFPNIWLNHISDKLMILIYFAPVDEENTILYIRFYCKLSRLRIVNNFIAFFGKFANKRIERQDKRVVITQKPSSSSLKSGERLLVGDGPIITYRRHREELMTRHGK
ncbi:aromatic ring-hydroxylating dioxygenase subunit alpha [uncultured Sphaerochaeta sp.]|uniref:aromatic ring-hydroxylating dioxygenase subunit alpha n=1 Tax=uncultured Sphaerochaeta sp. TaxID=886478 RepID=UPI002A0A5D09|nr:aromatic ring-hydroxylating dioxygenase subunit alpha [uncultured Sphaerochaeta sp.]